jgi:chitodextrinase
MAIHRHIVLFASLFFGLCWASLSLANSVEFFVNATGSQNQDHADQTVIPAGFGDGEFTLELWIKPNDSFPVGPVVGGNEQLQNWASDDNAPYSSGTWWYKGNFLLDGHNNGSGFSEGTFSLQFYGGGRVRWLFGDGPNSIPTGGLWNVGASPASSTPSLLDGAWHHLTLVRRWSGQSSSQLELWIDGSLVDTETTPSRTNMRQYWDTWQGFPGGQEGWFWGAEKQAVVGILSQYEDYKGLIDEMRFWSRAKTTNEITTGYANPVVGSEPGLVGNYTFSEAQGGSVCDSLDTNRCLFLQNSNANVWSGENAPLAGSGDTISPSTPGNLQGVAVSAGQVDLSWNAASDNVGVTGYILRRDGAIIATPAGTSFSDTSVSASNAYSYTVAARDAAGNVSPQSGAVQVTTPAAADTQAPTTPTGLQGVAASASRITLSWNAASDNVGVTGYEIRRDGVLINTVAITSFEDMGLTQNTAYSYTVSARDAAGNVSAPSAAVQVVTQVSTDTEAPSVPGGFQGSAASATQINLSWNASSDNVGVTDYLLRRDGVPVATVPAGATSYSDMGLTQNTTYTYTVAARDDAGNVSAQSAPVSVTTQISTDTQAPSVPGGLQGNVASSSRIDLSWNAASDNVGVTGYEIQRDGAAVGTTAGTSYADTGLSANTRYVYAVVALDAAGNRSTPSAAVGATTDVVARQSDGGGGALGLTGMLLIGIGIGMRRRRAPKSW